MSGYHFCQEFEEKSFLLVELIPGVVQEQFVLPPTLHVQSLRFNFKLSHREKVSSISD